MSMKVGFLFDKKRSLTFVCLYLNWILQEIHLGAGYHMIAAGKTALLIQLEAPRMD